MYLGCVLFLIFILYNKSCLGHYEQQSQGFGPVVRQTNGQPWPKPQLSVSYGPTVLRLRPTLLQLKIQGRTCKILDEAVKRYYFIVLKEHRLLRQFRQANNSNLDDAEGNDLRPGQYLDVVNIHLMDRCEDMPHDEMDETYELKINSPDYPGQGFIAASSNWGILRALETFSQLIHPTSDFTSLQVASIWIVDYPRFPFRSLLIDTSRHFLKKYKIFETLDLMAMNKYNVLHWHIVDDQAFPYQSTTFPQISDSGAYHPYTHVYTQKDVADVIEYAAYRGIRVIPEFDSPGHTQSWGSIPNFLTKCYNKTTGKPTGDYGPANPIVLENYQFLHQLFSEVAQVFPDKYIHLGGDEVDFSCWESNPEIQNFMKGRGLDKDYTRLEEIYMQKLVDEVESLPQNKSCLVWQEVFDNNVTLVPNTIIHVWIDNQAMGELANITAKGYRVVLSACWYLNYISYGSDWVDYYKCDPHNFTGTAEQKRLVIGGGAAMWGEYVDDTNITPRTWPRAAAPAERLWSSEHVTDLEDAARRLEEHRCRLLRRGFQVSPPNGSGYCL